MGTPNKLPECHPDLNGAGLKIGIAMSRFNIDVCEGLLGACVTELLKLGVAKEDIFLASVPGALEISLVLQKMAKSGKFDALVALGAIIRGETYHFELVANESGSGVTRARKQRSKGQRADHREVEQHGCGGGIRLGGDGGDGGHGSILRGRTPPVAPDGTAGPKFDTG